MQLSSKYRKHAHRSFRLCFVFCLVFYDADACPFRCFAFADSRSRDAIISTAARYSTRYDIRRHASSSMLCCPMFPIAYHGDQLADLEIIKIIRSMGIQQFRSLPSPLPRCAPGFVCPSVLTIAWCRRYPAVLCAV